MGGEGYDSSVLRIFDADIVPVRLVRAILILIENIVTKCALNKIIGSIK